MQNLFFMGIKVAFLIPPPHTLVTPESRPNDFLLQKLLFSVSELLNSASGTIFFQFTGFGFNEFFF